jgi:hypothetical protein
MWVPPWWRAKRKLYNAVRAPPTWRLPVGEGAKRTRTDMAGDLILLRSCELRRILQILQILQILRSSRSSAALAS